MSNPTLEQVRKRLEREKTSFENAAAEIGVTTQSLTRHLSGEYVRSDSIAKYHLWLERPRDTPVPHVRNWSRPSRVATDTSAQPGRIDSLWEEMHFPLRPHTVVDIFSGCGGLSVGFEHFGDGKLFRTTLALDIEAPMVRVFNDNHPGAGGELPRGRQIDITDFLNEAEIQAFYLDHLARSGQDTLLASELRDLAGFDLQLLRAELHRQDQAFLKRLEEIRSTADYVAEYRNLGSDVLGQTSVIAFHRSLKLPSTALGTSSLDTLLWSDDGAAPAGSSRALQADKELLRAQQRLARQRWNIELKRLTQKAGGEGTGQLSSSAHRIGRFAVFAESEPMRAIQRAWTAWRALREATRVTVFDNKRVQKRVQALYDQGRQVAVLLGGPPCQGFSRIGRGKIRSLREQSVHSHEHEESVDSRNQLLEHYVLFVGALAPRAFLFENVRGFQAVVRTGTREFDAAEQLANAIKEVSSRGLSYSVASRIVMASDHLVPQERERYLMVGLRVDVTAHLEENVAPEWCLTLPNHPPVPLEVPLEGLPEPVPAKDAGHGAASGEVRVEVSHTHLDVSAAASRLRDWLHSGPGSVTDSHISRKPRTDDAAFFDLMGPGKRWMDYRCDEAPTLNRLSQFVSRISRTLKDSPQLARSLGINAAEAHALGKLLDGSLSLRLLLESIPPHPGETEHHLLNANYLKKKEGQHGDWLSRMDPKRPSKTMVSHMAKDTYAFVHPTRPRTISIREAARIQTFPDSYRFASVGLVDAFRMIGNAVPPLLSWQFADRIAQVLWAADSARVHAEQKTGEPIRIAREA